TVSVCRSATGPDHAAQRVRSGRAGPNTQPAREDQRPDSRDCGRANPPLGNSSESGGGQGHRSAAGHAAGYGETGGGRTGKAGQGYSCGGRVSSLAKIIRRGGDSGQTACIFSPPLPTSAIPSCHRKKSYDYRSAPVGFARIVSALILAFMLVALAGC